MIQQDIIVLLLKSDLIVLVYQPINLPTSPFQPASPVRNFEKTQRRLVKDTPYNKHAKEW